MHLLHLLRADIRRFALLLAGWVLVQAMSAVYVGISPFVAADSRMAALLAVLGLVLTLARWLGLAAMVPLLMQTHPAVGSDAFWLTRPIPWRTLLLSKIVLIGALFVGLPMLLEAIIMAAFRLPLGEILSVCVQSMLLQALLVALLMALAALTQSLARFALAAGGLLLFFGVLSSIGLIFAMRVLYEGPQVNEVAARSGADSSPAAILLISVTAALALLIAVQYRSRSTRAAISAGVVGIALAVVLQFVWPWSYRVLAAPAWADRETALRLAVQAPRIEFSPHDQWMASHELSEWMTGTVRLRVSGVESSWLATLRLVESSLQLGDGSSLATVGNGYSMPLLFEGKDNLPSDAVIRDVLGVSRSWPVRWDERRVMDSVPAIVLREADVRNRLGTAATYRGRFIVDLDQYQIAATLPLQPGAEFHDRGDRIVIESTVLRGSAAQVRVRRITTTSLFDPGSRRQLHFYLRNARTSDAIVGFERDDARSIGVGTLMLAGAGVASSSERMGFDARRQLIAFSGDAPPNQQGFEITPDWLSQSELAIVRQLFHGSVTRTVEIPRVEMVESPRKTTMR